MYWQCCTAPLWKSINKNSKSINLETREVENKRAPLPVLLYSCREAENKRENQRKKERKVEPENWRRRRRRKKKKKERKKGRREKKKKERKRAGGQWPVWPVVCEWHHRIRPTA